MLWSCAYTWHPTTTVQQVRGRIMQQDETGTNLPDKIRGWYDLAGGRAGFLLIETDDPGEINAFCQPCQEQARAPLPSGMGMNSLLCLLSRNICAIFHQLALAMNQRVVGFGPVLLAQPKVRGVLLGNPSAGKTFAVASN